MPKTRSRKPATSIISKEAIAKEIARIIEERELTQTEASQIVGDAPSQLSLIVTGKLAGFSSERLLRTFVRLGRDVEVRISGAKRGSGKVRIRVA